MKTFSISSNQIAKEIADITGLPLNTTEAYTTMFVERVKFHLLKGHTVLLNKFIRIVYTPRGYKCKLTRHGKLLYNLYLGDKDGKKRT